MRRRTIVFAVFVVFASLVATACGARFKNHEETGGAGASASATTVAGSSTTTAAASSLPSGAKEPGPAPGVTDTEIKIGYLLPITGAAPIPSKFDKGVNAYWSYVNSKGGINGRKVTAIIEDTQSQAEVAKDKAKKLIEDDKVFTIIALDRLENQQAIQQYLNDRKFPNIQVQTQPDLAQDQVWTFNITIDQGDQGALIADYMVKVLKYNKVGIMTENTPMLTPGHDKFKKEAEKLGAKVVYEKTIEGTQNDFSNEALGLKNSGAQSVWMYMAPTPAASIANQALAAGFHPTWFANSISFGFNLTFLVSPEGLKGARAFSPWLPLDDPRTDTYKKAYVATNPGETPDDLGLLGWGIGQVVGAGIEKTGPKLGQNAFRDAMQHLHFTPDLWAPITFDPGVREGANVVAVLKEDGGKWVLEHDFASKF